MAHPFHGQNWMFTALRGNGPAFSDRYGPDVGDIVALPGSTLSSRCYSGLSRPCRKGPSKEQARSWREHALSRWLVYCNLQGNQSTSLNGLRSSVGDTLALR